VRRSWSRVQARCQKRDGSSVRRRSRRSLPRCAAMSRAAARQRSPRLVQGSQQEMIAGELAAGLPGLLGGVLDQPLRVGRVRGLVAAASRAAPPPARLETRAHQRRVQPEALQHRLGPPAGTEDREQDVLRSNGLMAEPAGFLPRLGQRLLSAGTKGARVDAGCGFGGQSGLASSMSMMGMPSSTA